MKGRCSEERYGEEMLKEVTYSATGGCTNEQMGNVLTSALLIHATCIYSIPCLDSLLAFGRGMAASYSVNRQQRPKKALHVIREGQHCPG